MTDQELKNKLNYLLERNLKIINTGKRLLPHLAHIAESEGLEPLDISDILFQCLEWSSRTNHSLLSKSNPVSELPKIHLHLVLDLIKGFQLLTQSLRDQGVPLDESLLVDILKKISDCKPPSNTDSKQKTSADHNPNPNPENKRIRLMVDNS